MPQTRGSALLAAIVLVAGVAAGDQPAVTEGAAAPADPSEDGAKPGQSEPIEEIVVRGLRTGHFRDSPSSFTTVIHTDQYEAERKRLEDLLAQEVGVQLRRHGGPGEPAELSIRGSTASQVAVTLDGVPMNSALTGKVNLAQVCLGLVDTAAVTRGAATALPGGGAIGGVVSLETRRPGVVPVTRIEASGGAFDTWEASILRSARAGPLEYSVGYCGFTTAGDFLFARPVFESVTRSGFDPPIIRRINNQRVRHSASLSLGGEIGSKSHLRFRDYFTYATQGEPGRDALDEPLGGQNPFAEGRDLHNLAQLDWSSVDLGVFGSELSATLYHRYEQNHFENPGIDENDEPVDSTTHVSTIGLSGSDVWGGELLAAEHRLTLGFDAKRDSLFSDVRTDRGRTHVGLVLQEEAAFWGQRLTFVPAVRLEWNEGLGERWLPSLGIVAAPVPWLRIKGNVQSAYRVPSFNELYFPDKGYIRGNPNLAPESGRSADLGLDLILARLGPILDLSFSAAFFVQKIEDSIVWVPISPFTDAPVNMGPAKLHGYELALAFGVTEYLRLSANHTGLRSESSVTGLPLPGRAENETFFRAQLGPPGIWKLTAELHRLGEIPVSASGSRLLPARSVWNASASLNLAGIPGVGLDRFVDELWLYVTLNNISDIAVRDLLFAPQPGRSGYLGMEIEW